MNHILISDPFLFRPSGEEPIVQEYPNNYDNNNNNFYYPQHQHNYYSDYYYNNDDFIAFTKSQFEEDWKNNSSDELSSVNLFPLNQSHDHTYSTTDLFSSIHHYHPNNNNLFLDTNDDDMEKELLFLLNDESLGPNEEYAARTEHSQTLSEGNDFDLENNEILGLGISLKEIGDLDPDLFYSDGLADGKKSDLANQFGYQFSPASTSVGTPAPVSEESFANNILDYDNNSNDSMKMVTSRPFVSMNQIHGAPTTISNQQQQFGTRVSSTRSHVRKTSHTPRQAPAASPLFNNFYDDDDTNTSSITDVKPTEAELAAYASNGKKRTVSTRGKSGGGKIVSKTNTPRQKMYESDDPKARNAKLARQNREKKKHERDQLERENIALNTRIQQKSKESANLTAKVHRLEAELAEAKLKNRAEGGLQKVFSNAKDVLETIMPPLISKFGPFDLKAAEWFSRVGVPLDGSPMSNTILANSAPTSSYITLNISTSDRLVHVDYNPEIPAFAKQGK